MTYDDSDLIQQTLEGDQQAFAALVEKYQKQIHALAWQQIGDFHIAQEITQDAFFTAFQKLSTLTDHNRFAGWLYVITNRKCIAWHRKKAPQPQSLEATDPVELEEVYYSEYMTQQREEAANQKRRAIVQKLLSKLQESERTVVNLYYIAGMTCEDIGKFLGVSPNTVRSRLHRARNKMKKDETMIQENLSSFQLPTQFTENIMKEISRLNPIAPSGSKPLVPLAISAASAIMFFLLIGFGAQNLIHFQEPYQLDATSESMIEIVDTQYVLDTSAKPALQDQIGRSDVTGKSNGIAQNPDFSLFAAAHDEDAENSKLQSQWVQTKGPEGGEVPTLFKTTRGDVYAGAQQGLYRLTDDGTAWKLISNIKGPSHIALIEETKWWPVIEETKWWPVVERHDTLYLATNKEILASTDRGETWKTLGESIKGQPVGMVISDEIPGSKVDMTIYVAYTNGVFRTDDLCESWTPLSEGLTDRKIRTIATVENTVFAGTDKGLYRLNNDIWEHLPIGKAGMRGKTLAILDLTVAEHRIYIAVGKEITHQYGQLEQLTTLHNSEWTLYKSIDKGDSWDSIDPRTDFLKNEFRSSNPKVKITASAEKILVQNEANYFYSIDAGENWKSLALGNSSYVYNTSAAVLYDVNTFYKSGIHGIHRTTDGGKSLQQFNTGLIGSQVFSLASLNNTLYVYADAGLFSSSYGGESWDLVPSDSIAEKLIVGHDGVLYACAATLRLMRLSDQEKKLTFIQGMPNLENSKSFGNNWIEKKMFVEQLSDEDKIIFTDRLTLQSVPEKIDNVKLADKVEHFVEIHTSAKITSFAVSDAAFYVESKYKLFRWKPGTSEWHYTGLIDEDARDNFKNSDTLFDTTSFKIAVLGKTVYAGKRDGHLMQSFDEGTRWNDVTKNLPFPVKNFNAITFAGQTVYVATDKGVIRSSNGTDWHIPTDVEGTPLIVGRFAVDDTTVYGESEQKVYQLNGNTATWEQVTPEIPHKVTCIDVDENTLYVGTSGRGVLRFTLDE